jgi:hypothetical protein
MRHRSRILHLLIVFGFFHDTSFAQTPPFQSQDIEPVGFAVSTSQTSGGAGSANPHAALVQGSDGSVYDTAQFGGTKSMGSVLKLYIG